jgi:hypothetical protein
MPKRASLKALDSRLPIVGESAHHKGEGSSALARPSKPQPSRNGQQGGNGHLPESVWRSQSARRKDSTIDGLMRRGSTIFFAEHNINRGAAEI